MEKLVAQRAGATWKSIYGPSPAEVDFRPSVKKLGFVKVSRLRPLQLIKAMDESATTSVVQESACISGNHLPQISTAGKSTNILWHKSSVDKLDRQQLLQQKGCVIWITGLSGSGRRTGFDTNDVTFCFSDDPVLAPGFDDSNLIITLAGALSQALHSRGKLTYILDGDNCRHGLNCDLSFKAEDRVENIRRIGEVAKLFADAGVICIACLISPYRKDRDASRSMLPEGDFIEVFMDVPLQVCEARDPKGLYKLARAGKIKGFTGIDDPYEPPLNCEIVLKQKGNNCCTPGDMAETVVSYLDEKGYLLA